jgi:hypothetical protein
VTAPAGASTVIVPQFGGSVTIASALTTTLSFPPGAVTQTITVTMREVQEPPSTMGSRLLGRALVITAVGADATPVTSFQLPLTIDIYYQIDNTNGIDEQMLALFHWDPTRENWVAIQTAGDPANHRLTAVLD